MSTIQTLILTEAQAQSLVTEIKAGIIEIGDKLKELHDGEGWKALGYDNWKECYSKEFNFSKSRVYQLLAHVNVRENITAESTVVDSPAHERQSRELADLDPADQPKAWKQAQDEAGTEQPTAKQVRQAADNFRPVPKSKSLQDKGKGVYTSTGGGIKQAAPSIDAEFHDKSTPSDSEPRASYYAGPGNTVYLTLDEIVNLLGELDDGDECPYCGVGYH